MDNVKEILLRFDEAGRYETPKRFNYDALNKKVIVLIRSLEAEFELTFEGNDQIQDASYFCEILIPVQLVTDPKPTMSYMVRISNFGSLATIHMEEAYKPFVITRIINLLEQHGFIYINIEALNADYDGRFEKFKEILGGTPPSWFTRYFDYL